jgi:hypothetical protein
MAANNETANVNAMPSATATARGKPSDLRIALSPQPGGKRITQGRARPKSKNLSFLDKQNTGHARIWTATDTWRSAANGALGMLSCVPIRLLPKIHEQLEASAKRRNMTSEELAAQLLGGARPMSANRSILASRLWCNRYWQPHCFCCGRMQIFMQLPLTREECRDSAWAKQRPCHRQANTFIKPTRFFSRSNHP